MNELERDLHDALRRVDAPAGFAARTIGLARTSAGRRVPWWWATAAAMVVVVLLIGGLAAYRDHQRRLESERAKAQLLFALQLTESKFERVRQRLADMEQRTIQLPPGSLTRSE